MKPSALLIGKELKKLIADCLILAALSMLIVCFAGCCPKPLAPEDTYESHSLGHDIALYLPNRIFDLLDIFRIRARIGPGASVGIRATKYVQAYLGAYISLYLGLPGPRREQSLPIPIGFDSLNGLQLSVLDETANTCFDPRYTDSEIGISATILLLGFDLGIDPVEIWDFLQGFLGGDYRRDDL